MQNEIKFVGVAGKLLCSDLLDSRDRHWREIWLPEKIRNGKFYL